MSNDDRNAIVKSIDEARSLCESDKVVETLAKLPDDDYESQRKTAAKSMGWRLASLDRAVAEKRAANKLNSDGSADGDDDEQQIGELVQKLLSFAEPKTLFHDDEGEAYAEVEVENEDGQHVECWPVMSRGFSRWLRYRYYKNIGVAIEDKVLKRTIDTIEARAVFDGQELPVHRRVARVGDDVFVDLANDRWEVVEISGGSWHVINACDCPIKFFRSANMKPLPDPVSGGSVEEIRSFANMDGSDEGWQLAAVWLVAVLTGTSPFVILALLGEQGSCKSTAARVFRALTDPNKAPIRSSPQTVRDLMVCAKQSGMVALDNVGEIKPWLSDGLCCLSTGGGIAGRTLYTDSEESVITAIVPVLLTAVGDVVQAPDLLDRSVLIELPRIGEEDRRDERTLWNAFDTIKPQAFGALLKLAAEAMVIVPKVKLAQVARMADYERLGVAVEQAAGWEPGSFSAAYSKNRRLASGMPLENSPIGVALIELAGEGKCLNATWTDLLDLLNARIDDSKKRADGYPKSASALSSKVRMLANALRGEGIVVESGRTGGRRWVSLSITQKTPGNKGTESSSSPSSRHLAGGNVGDSGGYEDGHGDGVRGVGDGDDGVSGPGDGVRNAISGRNLDDSDGRDGDDDDALPTFIRGSV